jgi:nitrite reductase/ring-hydroxylating ferredoxin subunit
MSTDPLAAWYLVAGADALPRSGVLGFRWGGEGGVVVRGPGGWSALDRRCPHMGADLAAGSADDGAIVCPLHGLAFGPDGACRDPRVASARRYAVSVGSRALFVYPAASTTAEVPAPTRKDLRFAPAATRRVPVPWRTLMANAFDLHHLRTVHGRVLLGDPVVDAPGPDRFRLRYRSRVAGTTRADRVLRRLSGEHVDVSLTCWGGPVLVIESTLKHTGSGAVVGLVPDGPEATTLHLLVGVPPGPGVALRARIARWLYLSFLERDLPALLGSAFTVRGDLPEDAVLRSFSAFLDARPTA